MNRDWNKLLTEEGHVTRPAQLSTSDFTMYHLFIYDKNLSGRVPHSIKDTP